MIGHEAFDQPDRWLAGCNLVPLPTRNRVGCYTNLLGEPNLRPF
jgi:hypothetical protein